MRRADFVRCPSNAEKSYVPVGAVGPDGVATVGANPPSRFGALAKWIGIPQGSSRINARTAFPETDSENGNRSDAWTMNWRWLSIPPQRAIGYNVPSFAVAVRVCREPT